VTLHEIDPTLTHAQTMDEFKDFEKYVKGVDPYGMQSGIVLIDPPEEWYAHPLCSFYMR
jgi:hypothetical protein